MREIKFRAYDNERKLMIGADYAENFGNENDEWYMDEPTMSIMGITWLNKDKRFNIMQYTGLKDINNKEIYEGDIVYLAGRGNTLIEFPFIDLYESCFENDIGSIIGNMYENPELLNETK